MKKKISHAFGKDVYLLGMSKENNRYLWLEAPSWDCGWYWGFGYVEQYTNHKAPDKAKDTRMHTHWDSLHNEGNPFKETTFNKEEYKELKELFNRFYSLKEGADKNTNEVVLPEIFKQIIKILTP